MQNFDINLENLTEQKREQILSLVKEANNPTLKSLWKPECDGYYFTIANQGDNGLVWLDDDIDNYNYSIGNVFQTKEEAEFVIERLKVIAELRRYADEHNKPIDWKDGHCKYCVCYNHIEKRVSVASVLSKYQFDTIFFSSKEKAEDAIKEVGEDRIKKYLFKIKD